MDLDEFELSARRGKYAQIVDAQASDVARMAEIATVNADRQVRVGEAMGYLDALRATADGAAFATEMERWCRRPGFTGFVGPNGQMFLKQLVQAGEPGEGAALLATVLVAPEGDGDAVAKLRRTLDFIDRVKQNGHPGPARAPFLLSFFWALQDETSWPVAWASAVKTLSNLGWHRPTGDHATDYVSYARLVRNLGTPTDVTHALYWYDNHRFVGLAPSLVDRCAHGRELAQRVDNVGRYLDSTVEEAAAANTLAIIYELWQAGSGLQQRVAETLGRSVKLQYAKSKTGPNLYRWWGWVSWPAEGGNASLRLWATADGVLIGLHPGHARSGWYDEAGRLAMDNLPQGYEFFQLWEGEDSGQVRSSGTTHIGNEFLVGRFLPGTTALDRTDLADDIMAVAADLQGLLDRLYAAADIGFGEAQSAGEPEADGAPTATVSGSDLAALDE